MIDQIRELRKQAESAVQDMADGELKVKAFEVAFQHLLSGSKSGVSGRPSPDKQKVAKPASDSIVPRSVAERILSLQVDGFFSAQRSIREIQDELRKHGWHYAQTGLSGPLQILVQKRALRREQLQDGNRRVWKYANY